MNYPLYIFLIFSLSASSAFAVNTTTVDRLLENYRQQGAHDFDSKAGEKLWHQSFKNPKTGKLHNCTSCHSKNLRKPGKHVRTGKHIDPLAPSVNAKRLTDIRKVKKWLLRNCKWTLDRECTAQEKGNILRYLQSQ